MNMVSTRAIRAFVQARMSSTRFPGKVLAPFRGEPLVRHLLRSIRQVLPDPQQVIVLTSVEASDDPLAAYLDDIGVTLFRGPLDDVFERFRLCTARFPCEWIMRLNADSPLLDPGVAERVFATARDGEYDVVTTVFPRTFARGQNAELIRVATFIAVDSAQLSSEEREHVTLFFYRHPERFRIRNVESGNPALSALSLAVDTVDDLRRLEAMTDAEVRSAIG